MKNSNLTVLETSVARTFKRTVAKMSDREALVIGWGLGLAWLFGHGADEKVTAARACAFLVLLAESALLVVGPWSRSIFADWDLARGGYLALYLLIIAVQGVALWRSTSASSSPRSG